MVAALNAASWWSLPRVPSQDSRAWTTWIARCGARYGAATRVDLLHRHLGLAAVSIVPEAYAIEDALAQDVPVEGTIWVPSAGLHAVLLVPGRDARRKPCAIALGMIRTRPGAIGKGQTGNQASTAIEYVQERTSVEGLLDRHCFPVGNPNRRFCALVPRRGRRA
jgi:hypothetical protein